MAREISPFCDFISRSILTGLPMAMVDMELTIRMVKGIHTYRKDHTAESMVFSPWSRTIISFPSLHKKIQAFWDENRQTSAWNKSHAMPYFSAQPQPKCICTWGKTRTRWSNWRNRFNPIKTEWYNMQDRDTIDFNKIDIIKPTLKRLCMRPHGECMYCLFDTPHLSATPSDWSREDWCGKKAKTREQCLFLDLNILEKQIPKILQDRAQDIPQDMIHGITTDKQETNLINGIQDLMLEPKLDVQNSTDIPPPPPDVPEVKSKEKMRQTDQQQHQHMT